MAKVKKKRHVTRLENVQDELSKTYPEFELCPYDYLAYLTYPELNKLSKPSRVYRHITDRQKKFLSEITLTLTDSDSVVYYLEINRKIQKKSSQEILAAGNMQTDSADSSVSSSTPIILKSSEILKATTTGSDVHIIVSALEMT